MQRRVGALATMLMLLFAVACAPQNAATVIKLGVIAPFEGAGRPLGYAVLPVIQDAVAQANAAGAFSGYRVAVVAFNDELDPATASQQAKALALDADVMAVVGPFTDETAAAAVPVLQAAGVPVITLSAADPAAREHAANIAAAQKAADTVIDALAAQLARDGKPSRANLAASLPSP